MYFNRHLIFKCKDYDGDTVYDSRGIVGAYVNYDDTKKRPGH